MSALRLQPDSPQAVPMKPTLRAWMMVALCCAPGCQPSVRAEPESTGARAAAASASAATCDPKAPLALPAGEEVSAEWVVAHRCQLRIVDVREPDELRASGVIANSEPLPLGQLEESQGAFRRDQPVLFVCRSGRRSLAAQRLLQSKGHAAARSLAGGMVEWQRLGLPTAPPR